MKQLQYRYVPVKDWEEAQKAMRLFEKAGFENDVKYNTKEQFDFLYTENRMNVISTNYVFMIANHEFTGNTKLSLSELHSIIEKESKGKPTAMDSSIVKLTIPQAMAEEAAQGLIKPVESDVFSNYLNGAYQVYREQVDGMDYYYQTVKVLLKFLPQMGRPSGNIFDFDGSGMVNVSDLLTLLDGDRSIVSIAEEVLESSVIGKFSSGWIMQTEGYQVSFIKVTPSDEGGDFTPDDINTFFFEGITDEGVTHKFWACKIG